MSERKAGLFFTGTGTEVGKTYVAALAARALAAEGREVGVYKPVASGCLRKEGGLVSEDAAALWEAAGRPGELEAVCPQRFEAPLAPHLAAREEGREIDGQLLRSGLEYWRERSEIVVVEGAGGLLSPVTEGEYVADLAEEFGYPLIVVAANVLGTINATLTTLLAAAVFGEGLDVAGVVLNDLAASRDDPSAASNPDELAGRCVPPVLGRLAWGGTELDRAVDWASLAGGETG